MPGDDSGRITEVTRAAVAAAAGLARSQGLPGDDPEVLSSRGNVIVHLRPAPVVARVATLTAWTRSDPFGWLAREVAVAGYAASHGAPVVPPTGLADPGPHWCGGLAVSLWTWVPQHPSQEPERPSPAQAGDALARLHLAAAGYPGELPVLSPLRAQISDALAALERRQVLGTAVLAALRDRHARVLADLNGPAGRACHAGPALVLHGDAHAGNMVRSAGAPGRRWLWLDLEETCRGPREFDLAVLAGSGGTDGAAALAAYASATGTPVPEPSVLAPFSRARELEGTVWMLCMAHHYPDRYRQQARAALTRVLAAG